MSAPQGITGSRYNPETGAIEWNTKKPGVSWPATGNVTQTFYSKGRTAESRPNPEKQARAVQNAKLNSAREQLAMAQRIGTGYGQKTPWNAYVPKGGKGKRKTKRRSKKSRKTRRKF
jgi:hypothetical protein